MVAARIMYGAPLSLELVCAGTAECNSRSVAVSSEERCMVRAQAVELLGDLASAASRVRGLREGAEALRGG